MQRLDADFLEKDDVIVAMILEADVAFVGTSAALRFEIEFAFGNGLAFGVVGDGDIVENNNGARAIERNDHGIPLGTGLAGLGERFGQRIKHPSDVIIVFFRSFGVIVDLNLVAIVNRHPFFARLDGDSNEDSGIIVEVAHLVDHADAAVGKLAAGPVEKAHAAMRSNEAVLDGHVARADVFPAGEILAIEERLPCGSLRLGGERGRDDSDDQHWNPFAAIHGELLLKEIKLNRGAAVLRPYKEKFKTGDCEDSRS